MTLTVTGGGVSEGVGLQPVLAQEAARCWCDGCVSDFSRPPPAARQIAWLHVPLVVVAASVLFRSARCRSGSLHPELLLQLLALHLHRATVQLKRRDEA